MIRNGAYEDRRAFNNRVLLRKLKDETDKICKENMCRSCPLYLDDKTGCLRGIIKKCEVKMTFGSAEDVQWV